MQIHINGQTFELDQNNSESFIHNALALFLTAQQTDKSFAVALNGNFVAKSTYTTTPVKANDSIDVLFPIVGG